MYLTPDLCHKLHTLGLLQRFGRSCKIISREHANSYTNVGKYFIYKCRVGKVQNIFLKYVNSKFYPSNKKESQGRKNFLDTLFLYNVLNNILDCSYHININDL